MTKLRARAALALLLPLAVAACDAGRSGYPSLAPRPIERLSLGEPDRPAPPSPAADPQALARLQPLIDQARSADAQFHSALDQARPALERGRVAAAGSDAWLDAQQALSRVETAREPVARALAALDAARFAVPADGDTGQAAATARAYAIVQEIDAGERQALAALWPGPS